MKSSVQLLEESMNEVLEESKLPSNATLNLRSQIERFEATLEKLKKQEAPVEAFAKKLEELGCKISRSGCYPSYELGMSNCSFNVSFSNSSDCYSKKEEIMDALAESFPGVKDYGCEENGQYLYGIRFTI